MKTFVIIGQRKQSQRSDGSLGAIKKQTQIQDDGNERDPSLDKLVH